MLKIYFFTFVLLLFNGFSTQAGVNLTTGQFHHDESDFTYIGQQSYFELWRAYNSQQKTAGLFGKSWCSSLEYSLVFQKKAGFQVKLCESIEASFPTKGKTIKKNLISGLRSLAFNGSNYTYASTTNIMRFDRKGRLIGLIDKNTEKGAMFTYKPKSILIRAGKRNFTLFLTKQKRASAFRVNLRQKIRFNYTGSFLKSVRKLKGERAQYEYKNAKLRKIFDRKGNKVEILHKKNGLVSALILPNKCKEDYRYQSIKRGQIRVAVAKTCDGELLYRHKYLLSYNKDKKLTQIKDLNKKRTTELDPKTGLAKIEIYPKAKKTYDYDKQGRVKSLFMERPSETYKAHLQYNSSNNISRIFYKNRNKKDRDVRLTYDKKNKIRSIASQPNGYFNFYYKGQRIEKIELKGQAHLYYKYGRNKNLRQVMIKENKKTYSHNINKKNNSRTNLKFLQFFNRLHSSLGPAKRDLRILGDIL